MPRFTLPVKRESGVFDRCAKGTRHRFSGHPRDDAKCIRCGMFRPEVMKAMVAATKETD